MSSVNNVLVEIPLPHITSFRHVDVTPAGEIHIEPGNDYMRPIFLSPEKAKELGTALLHAAQHAEAQWGSRISTKRAKGAPRP